jgi:hypothetical protein
MDVNPYEPPSESGYSTPRKRSGWRDFVACVAVALLIHAVIQSAAQAYRILGLDWTSRFADWNGFIRVTYTAVLAVILAMYVVLAGLVMFRRRKANRN